MDEELCITLTQGKSWRYKDDIYRSYPMTVKSIVCDTVSDTLIHSPCYHRLMPLSLILYYGMLKLILLVETIHSRHLLPHHHYAWQSRDCPFYE